MVEHLTADQDIAGSNHSWLSSLQGDRKGGGLGERGREEGKREERKSLREISQ